MTPDITNSTLVDAPHLETLFHTEEKALYLCPKGVNQFEVIAELRIAPVNLGKHVPFRTIYPANLSWDGKNEAGEQVSSGVYFYTIQAGEFTATRNMVMAK